PTRARLANDRRDGGRQQDRREEEVHDPRYPRPMKEAYKRASGDQPGDMDEDDHPREHRRLDHRFGQARPDGERGSGEDRGDRQICLRIGDREQEAADESGCLDLPAKCGKRGSRRDLERQIDHVGHGKTKQDGGKTRLRKKKRNQTRGDRKEDGAGAQNDSRQIGKGSPQSEGRADGGDAHRRRPRAPHHDDGRQHQRQDGMPDVGVQKLLIHRENPCSLAGCGQSYTGETIAVLKACANPPPATVGQEAPRSGSAAAPPASSVSKPILPDGHSRRTVTTPMRSASPSPASRRFATGASKDIASRARATSSIRTKRMTAAPPRRKASATGSSISIPCSFSRHWAESRCPSSRIPSSGVASCYRT